MRAESLELEIKSQVAVSQSILQKLQLDDSSIGSGSNSSFHENDSIGGVIHNGQLAWIAKGSNFEVVSLKSGNRVASYSFDDYHTTSRAIITCVAEVNTKNIKSCLLIIGVQRLPVGGLLYLFSVQGSRIIRRIDVIDKITSCCFVNEDVCKRGNLKAFGGCAAIGTESGEIFLIDLNLSKCKEIGKHQLYQSHRSDDSSCKIVEAILNEQEIHAHVKQTRCENINLGIKLDVSDVPKLSPATAILSMPQMQMIAIGFENGLMALYNLTDLNALHLAYPPEDDSPLVKLTYLEPADDPRPCVYIWAFHSNRINSPCAVMHSVSFLTKNYQDGENIYETFQWSRPDLTVPINEKDSTPVSCQSITKIVSDEEDEQLSLCLLAWTNKVSSFVLVFDLNQWYKEQMPRICDWRDYPSYLAPFPVEINNTPFDIWLNSKSVAVFNSIQRPEEHFYPTSLSFDLIELTATKIYNLYWAGLQNNAIRKLNDTGAIAILLPDECFNEFLEASLIPQLSDQNYHANPSMKMKQEFLLSMALEYNCMSLLRDCAQQWADGSHMGPGAKGLTLSTMTDWIWNQAKLIKDRCNDLCVPLFDDSGITIDLRSRKILAHYSRQLKSLADLLQMIVTNCREYIPDEIFDELCCQRNSIRMTSEYQDVLQWLLNMGLLPEIVWNQLTLPEPANDTCTAIPYPYRILNEYYTKQRQRFYDIDRNHINLKTNSCKCLYIDSFIERECNSQLLRKEWVDGDGLYPPPSLQAMLRILLIPGISLENKYMLFVYLFLDLNMVLETEHFNAVQNLIKFPAVFKLNSTTIKTTQAFWNLDHNEYEIAMKELISPLTSDRLISQWQQELLVNTLLIKDMPNLALQALRAPGPPVKTELHIKTLLANNLITEAFELQRLKFDEDILLEFFKGCHQQKKWNFVLGLSMNEREGEILCKFLRTCDSLLSENLQLLYLLQRNKYIEALTYLDSLKHKPRSLSMQRKLENTQDLIISSYQLAMNATDRTFCDQYMTIKTRLPIDVLQRGENNVKPLSCELNPFIVDTNANVVGSVFHRTIVSAKRTGFPNPNDTMNPSKNYIPLLSNPRIDFDAQEDKETKPVLQPKPYAGLSKRRPDIWNDRNIDPELRQPAAKRQRVDSYSIADQQPLKHAPGINSFILSTLTSKANQILQKQNDAIILDDTIDVEDDQRNSYGELQDTVNLLSTPKVKSSLADRTSRMGSRCDTPQSILKHRHTEAGSIISRRSTSPSLTVHSAKRSVDFNEKTFRFALASHKNTENEEYRLRAIPERVAVNETDDASVRSSPISIKGRRPINSRTSSRSTSVDEFYSPEPSKQELSQLNANQTLEKDGIDDISRIPHALEIPTTRSQSKRRLRSATPDNTIDVMTSTRITRSRSKQTTDTADGTLNTSTPIRTIRKHSAERSVSKSLAQEFVDEANLEQKPNKIVDTIGKTHNASNQIESQKNLLNDASFASKSIIGRMNYEVDDTIGDSINKNILSDSDSVLIEKSEGNKEAIKKTRLDYDKKTVETELISKSSEAVSPDVSDKLGEDDNQMDESDEITIGKIVEQSIKKIVDQTVEEYVEPITDEVDNVAAHVQLSRSNQFQLCSNDSNIQNEMIVSESCMEKKPINLLTDASNMTESMLKKFNEYDTCTTSFYNDPTSMTIDCGNLLEGSSIHASLATHIIPESLSKSSSDSDDVVNIIDDDDSCKSSESEDAQSNNTISSCDDDEDIRDKLVYDESDNEDDDDVIQIISSSDDDGDSHNSKPVQIEESEDAYFSTNINEQQQYMNENFGLNNEFTSSSQSRESMSYENKKEEYNLTELSNATPTSGTQMTQEDAIHQMIYGDLDNDTEMLDLDINNAAIGFQIHSNHSLEEMPQGSFAIESNIPSMERTVNVEEEQKQIEHETGTKRVGEEEKSTETDTVRNDVVEEQSVGEQRVISVEPHDNIEKSSAVEVSEVIESTEAILEPAEKTNILEKAFHINSTNISASVINSDMESTDIMNQAMLVETGTTDPESTPAKPRKRTTSANYEPSSAMDTPARRTRRATSRDTERKEEPKETIVELPKTRLRKAASQQSLSQGDDPVQRPLGRSKRSASQQDLSQEFEVQTNQLTRRGSSQQNEISELKTPKQSGKISSRRTSKKKADEVEKIVEEVELKPKPLKRKNTKSESLDTEELGEAFNAEESVQSRRLRKATSHQTLNDIAENESKPQTRKAASHTNLSEVEVVSTPRSSRRKRTASETSEIESELGYRFSANENNQNRRLRKAVSHQTLTSIAESDIENTPKANRSRSRNEIDSKPQKPRRAVSHQSLSSLSEKEAPSPSTRSRKTKVTTETKPEVQIETKTPSKRARRAASVNSPEEVNEKKSTKLTRSTKKIDDETNSEASSIISTRSRKTATPSVDDESTSVKSTRTKRTARAGSVLPAIAEVENQQSTPTTDYLESSRLTRSQRAAIEKYANMKAPTSTEPTATRKTTRKQKTDGDQTVDSGSDDSDAESIKSGTSKISKISKASKKSKVSDTSSSQKTSRSLRSQKK